MIIVDDPNQDELIQEEKERHLQWLADLKDILDKRGEAKYCAVIRRVEKK